MIAEGVNRQCLYTEADTKTAFFCFNNIIGNVSVGLLVRGWEKLTPYISELNEKF
jgi:hypothetical protein